MHKDRTLFGTLTWGLSEARKLNALSLLGFENNKSIREWVLPQLTYFVSNQKI